MVNRFFVSYSYREPSGSLVDIGPLYVGEDINNSYDAYHGTAKNMAQMVGITDAWVYLTCTDTAASTHLLQSERVTPVID